MAGRRNATSRPGPGDPAGDAFRTLFAEHPVATWVYDPVTLAILEMNAAALRLYGYDRDDVAQLSLADHRAPI